MLHDDFGGCAKQLSILKIDYLFHEAMLTRIDRNDVFDKNLNFLIGSGASFGLLPTLEIGLKNSKTNKPFSLEELATCYEQNQQIHALLFSWYVEKVIKPASEFDLGLSLLFDQEEEAVIENYERFLTTILTMLAKKSRQKKVNIFTTNYDGLVTHTAEKMLQKGTANFVLNDGGDGFRKRTLKVQNFNRFYRHQGVFDKHSVEVAQINLVQLHGSVYWYKQGEFIEISYDKFRANQRVRNVPTLHDEAFDALLADGEKNEESLLNFQTELDGQTIDDFWEQYKQLPVVNPTKWKFHETVFEEHYYQSLRMLSYELEKPDTVFIVFGFSFADEHILNLVKRSLSNPKLKVYICCFNDDNYQDLNAKFKEHSNVELIRADSNLDFTTFNNEIFSSVTDEGV